MTENVYEALRLLNQATEGSFELAALDDKRYASARQTMIAMMTRQKVSKGAAGYTNFLETWLAASGTDADGFTAWARSSWDAQLALDPPATVERRLKLAPPAGKKTQAAAAARAARGVNFARGDVFYMPAGDAVLVVVDVTKTKMMVAAAPDQRIGGEPDKKYTPGSGKTIGISPFADGVKLPADMLTEWNARFLEGVLGKDGEKIVMAPGLERGAAQRIPVDTRGMAPCGVCGTEIPATDQRELEGKIVCSSCYSQSQPADSPESEDAVAQEAQTMAKAKKSAKKTAAPKAAKTPKAPKAKKAAGEPRKARAYAVAKALGEDVKAGTHKATVYTFVEKHPGSTTAEIIKGCTGKGGFSDKPDTARNTISFAVSRLFVGGFLKEAK